MRYWTGIERTSHLIPTTRATMCPGIGDGTLPVMLIVSSTPPARSAAPWPATSAAESTMAVSFLVNICMTPGKSAVRYRRDRYSRISRLKASSGTRLAVPRSVPAGDCNVRRVRSRETTGVPAASATIENFP